MALIRRQVKAAQFRPQAGDGAAIVVGMETQVIDQRASMAGPLTTRQSFPVAPTVAEKLFLLPLRPTDKLVGSGQGQPQRLPAALPAKRAMVCLPSPNRSGSRRNSSADVAAATRFSAVSACPTASAVKSRSVSRKRLQRIDCDGTGSSVQPRCVTVMSCDEAALAVEVVQVLDRQAWQALRPPNEIRRGSTHSGGAATRASGRGPAAFLQTVQRERPRFRGNDVGRLLHEKIIRQLL